MLYKDRLVKIAQDTIRIVSDGKYSVGTKTFDILSRVENSKLHTEIVTDFSFQLPEKGGQFGKVEVLPISTLAAAKTLGEGCVILNFASAKNPGGGFRNGSMAQEESLCYASSLYDSLNSQRSYYEYNRSNLNGGLYNNNMIYTPNMVVFRDDSNSLIAPYECSCITSPACNRQATRRDPRLDAQVPSVMAERITSILKLAVYKGHKSIVLGAFGCGVFSNDPKTIADLFNIALHESEYGKYFDRIIFAMKFVDKNYQVFRATLNS